MLQHWLGSMASHEFFTRYFRQEPFARPGNATSACRYFNWTTLGHVLGSRPAPDVLVVKNGRLVERAPPATLKDARAMFALGCSIVVRRAEQHDAGLLEVAHSFARDVPGEVSVQLYVTPRGFHGFGWHYDFEDVFIVQTRGIKEYLLRRNTVHPDPTRTTMPKDMHFELEHTPVLSSTLWAGDWLYIPRGWWHMAHGHEDALSISVGIVPGQQPMRSDRAVVNPGERDPMLLR